MTHHASHRSRGLIPTAASPNGMRVPAGPTSTRAPLPVGDSAVGPPTPLRGRLVGEARHTVRPPHRANGERQHGHAGRQHRLERGPYQGARRRPDRHHRAGLRLHGGPGRQLRHPLRRRRAGPTAMEKRPVTGPTVLGEAAIPALSMTAIRWGPPRTAPTASRGSLTRPELSHDEAAGSRWARRRRLVCGGQESCDTTDLVSR